MCIEFSDLEDLDPGLSELARYVIEHTEPGACRCGECSNSLLNSGDQTVVNRAVDVIFFEVQAKSSAEANALRELVESSSRNSSVDLLDDQEHQLHDLSEWMGSERLALMLMGLGTILGLWKLTTPKTMLDSETAAALRADMAAMGFLSVRAC